MKLFIIITLILFTTGCASTSFKTAQPLNIPVLMYHDINYDTSDEYAVTPETFINQMTYLYANGYNTVTFNNLKDANSKSVIITFDDGYASFLQYAAPVLEQYDFVAVINIVGEWVGKEIPNANPAPALTWDEIKMLSNNGVAQIGSHTNNLHKFTDLGVSNATYEELMEDFTTLNNRLEEVGIVTNTLSFPFGRYTAQAIKAALDSGYDYLQTSDDGMFTYGDILVKRKVISNISNLREIL